MVISCLLITTDNKISLIFDKSTILIEFIDIYPYIVKNLLAIKYINVNFLVRLYGFIAFKIIKFSLFE